MAINILAFSMMQGSVGFGGAGRAIQWLAGMTFSLYLFHYPLLRLNAAILPKGIDSRARVLLLMGVVLATIAALAAVTERKKKIAREIVEHVWFVGSLVRMWALPPRMRK